LLVCIPTEVGILVEPIRTIMSADGKRSANHVLSAAPIQ